MCLAGLSQSQRCSGVLVSNAFIRGFQQLIIDLCLLLPITGFWGFPKQCFILCKSPCFLIVHTLGYPPWIHVSQHRPVFIPKKDIFLKCVSMFLLYWPIRVLASSAAEVRGQLGQPESLYTAWLTGLFVTHRLQLLFSSFSLPQKDKFDLDYISNNNNRNHKQTQTLRG